MYPLEDMCILCGLEWKKCVCGEVFKGEWSHGEKRTN